MQNAHEKQNVQVNAHELVRKIVRMKSSLLHPTSLGRNPAVVAVIERSAVSHAIESRAAAYADYLS